MTRLYRLLKCGDNTNKPFNPNSAGNNIKFAILNGSGGRHTIKKNLLASSSSADYHPIISWSCMQKHTYFFRTCKETLNSKCFCTLLYLCSLIHRFFVHIYMNESSYTTHTREAIRGFESGFVQLGMWMMIHCHLLCGDYIHRR